jgi:hypothetical protein
MAKSQVCLDLQAAADRLQVVRWLLAAIDDQPKENEEYLAGCIEQIQSSLRGIQANLRRLAAKEKAGCLRKTSRFWGPRKGPSSPQREVGAQATTCQVHEGGLGILSPSPRRQK